LLTNRTADHALSFSGRWRGQAPDRGGSSTRIFPAVDIHVAGCNKSRAVGGSVRAGTPPDSRKKVAKRRNEGASNPLVVLRTASPVARGGGRRPRASSVRAACAGGLGVPRPKAAACLAFLHFLDKARGEVDALAIVRRARPQLQKARSAC